MSTPIHAAAKRLPASARKPEPGTTAQETVLPEDPKDSPPTHLGVRARRSDTLLDFTDAGERVVLYHVQHNSREVSPVEQIQEALFRFRSGRGSSAA